MKKLFLGLVLLLSACNPPKHHDLPDLGDNQIYFHGGPVLNNGVNVYLIWYGNWTNNTAVPILSDLIEGLNGSPYFNINSTYYDYTGKFVVNNVNLKGSINDPYSRSSVINDGDIYTIVTNALNQGKLPADENGIYLVLTSSDVDQTGGFCTKNCGWHSYAQYQGKVIKVAFIGDGSFRCQTNGNGILMNGSKAGQEVDNDGDGDVLTGANVFNSCVYQSGISPNNNPGADGMASVIAHELAEATTDPELDAWYDGTTSGECADKCAWNFGDTYSVTNGSLANVNLNSRDYLIQQNWVNTNGGYCALKY